MKGGTDEKDIPSVKDFFGGETIAIIIEIQYKEKHEFITIPKQKIAEVHKIAQKIGSIESNKIVFTSKSGYKQWKRYILAQRCKSLIKRIFRKKEEIKSD